MAEEESKGKSEWNEQQLFAQLFFDITKSCRYCQINHYFGKWLSCLESKISLVLGVVNKEQKKYLFEIRNKLNNAAIVELKKEKQKQGVLFNLLFYAESEIDTMAHEHMPFLKIKKSTDIGGM